MTDTTIPANAGQFYNHAAAWQAARADAIDSNTVAGFEGAFEEGFDAAGDYYRPIVNRLIQIEGDVMPQFRAVYDQLRAAQTGQDTWNGKEVADAAAALFDILGMDGAQ